MSQNQSTDLRRYLSTEAAPGAKFDVKLSGGIQAAEGSWIIVDEKQAQTSIKGEVPRWIPRIGGRKFEITLHVELLEEHRALVSVSGSVTGSAVGVFTTEKDELKIKDLRFSGHLETISEVSLTRWHRVETRASFYRIPYTRLWLESWFTPKVAAGLSSENYPSPRVHESALV